MFQRAVAHGAIVGIAAALASVAMPCLANDAAHKMAEKFAEPSPAATSDAATKREPTRAQDEARKDAQRKAEAARRAAQAKREAAAKAGDARRIAELLKADEMDMLARARLEAEERRAAEEEERLTTEARRLIELAAQERAKAEELLAGHPDAAKPAGREASVAESSRPQPAADRSATEPSPVKETDEETLSRRRAEEAKRLAEKLQRVRQLRESRLARETQRQPDPPEPQAAPPPSAIGAAPAQPDTDQAPVAAAPAFERPRVERLDPPSEAATPPAPVRPSEVAAAPVGTGQVDKDPQPRPVAPPPRNEVAHAPVEPPSRTATQPADTLPDEPRAQPDPERRSRLGAAPTRTPAAERAGAYGRVAVLLVMEPGNYGIRRRGPKVADPLLCMHHGCYVSAGTDQPAVFLPGRKALGLGNTFGKRAGACRKSLTCVFRDVELGGLPGYLQPVDLHVLKHDLRQGHAILADSDCRIDAGRLLCRHGIEAADYTMWIVPEELADAAGPEVLQRALTDRLDLPRSAALTPRP